MKIIGNLVMLFVISINSGETKLKPQDGHQHERDYTAITYSVMRIRIAQ